jgi:beta-mannosidase
MYYRKPLDFGKFLYVGQVLQAYGIQFAIEAHRRAMPYNMGSLVWQINDCWPVASWSSCDYYHRWKALQYEIKRSFEPVIISAFEQNGKTDITIISDKLEAIPAQLEMKLFNFSGKELSSKLVPVTLKSNAPSVVFSENTQVLSDQPTETYLLLTLKGKDGIISQKIYYFTQPKNLRLTKPTISSKVEIIDNKWIITLKSDVLAKDVYLNFEGEEGFFSDNYFDLLPGTVRKITFTAKDLSKKMPELSLISLVESYQ